MNEVFLYKDKEPVVKTFDIFKKLGYKDHRYLKRVVSKNELDFLDFGFLPLERQKLNKKAGRPEESYLLNEDQFIFLITLCKNTKEIVFFKKEITKQFSMMRKYLSNLAAQKQNQDWLLKRGEGKITRREETDTIKDFIEYASIQGSGSPKMYYTNISKMENKALFVITDKYKNVREVLNYEQLNTIQAADKIVSRALKEGMAKGFFYKDIYELARDRVLSFAELIGQSQIGAITYKQKLEIEVI